jgi:hypothetical protein
VQVYAGKDSGSAGQGSYSTEEKMKKGFTKVGLESLCETLLHCEGEYDFDTKTRDKSSATGLYLR